MCWAADSSTPLYRVIPCRLSCSCFPCCCFHASFGGRGLASLFCQVILRVLRTSARSCECGWRGKWLLYALQLESCLLGSTLVSTSSSGSGRKLLGLTGLIKPQVMRLANLLLVVRVLVTAGAATPAQQTCRCRSMCRALGVLVWCDAGARQQCRALAFFSLRSCMCSSFGHCTGVHLWHVC